MLKHYRMKIFRWCMRVLKIEPGQMLTKTGHIIRLILFPSSLAFYLKPMAGIDHRRQGFLVGGVFISFLGLYSIIADHKRGLKQSFIFDGKEFIVSRGDNA